MKKSHRKRKIRKVLTKQRKKSIYMVGGNYGKETVKYRLKTGKNIRVKRTKAGYVIEGYSALKIK